MSDAAYVVHCKCGRRIGIEGDFITAPEFSRVFGDLIGVWLVSEWVAMGSPSRLRVVEIGPGRGTLMADVLRATSNWPAFRHAARNIEMVEASPSLRIAQQRTLEVQPCSSEPGTWRLHDDADFGTCVRWHESMPAFDDVNDEVPLPTLFVAHELLDAMPAHQFVRTPSGWREKLIDVDDGPDSPHYFRYVLAPTTTPASAALAHSSYLRDYVADSDDNLEVSPGALAIVDDVARRIAVSGGAALFVDYGKETCLGDSLRAFKRHRQVSPLSEPGIVDLTVDTDFTSCARQAALVDGVTVFGPVQQGEWLGRMGIETRLRALLHAPYISESQVESLIAACERLLDPSQMGARYKVLAIVNHQSQSGVSEPPAGFLKAEQALPPPDALSVIAP